MAQVSKRFAGFTAAERGELAIALAHRLDEAEAGNAYVRWPVTGTLALELALDDGIDEYAILLAQVKRLEARG